MAITIQRESVNQCIDDIQPLLKKHWQEVALHQDIIALDPDYDRYRAIETAGKLVVIAARDGQILIGYSVFVLHNHIHYIDCFMATNDVLFLDKEYRKGTTAGIRLLRESEAILKGLGVHRVMWHIKPKNDWSAILSRMGYEQEEIIMGKLL